MNMKVLLDVAMPPEPALKGVAHGINWIIAFIIIAFAIAIVSVIIIRKGIKKYKTQEKFTSPFDVPEAEEVIEENTKEE
ncbi:MAG: hypothetical protein J5487_07475 [Lachnospiraceae bacterium]|nr:hypothetical protein [Lachnospiraceae bacterium]